MIAVDLVPRLLYIPLGGNRRGARRDLRAIW